MRPFPPDRGIGRRPSTGHRAALMSVAASWAALAACTVPPSGDRIEVFIPPGASLEAVAESLAVHGVVKSARAFEIYAGMSGGTDSIEGGKYYLKPAPLGELLPVLLRGPTLGKLSVPEGAMAVEVAVVVELGLSMPPDRFLAATRSEELRQRLGARGPTLEGYLYPTTYYVALDITAEDLVRRMVDEFLNHWRPDWTRLSGGMGLSPDEVVTLASIVSGETRDAEDRPLVASVYRNRLEHGMRLQADPTVVYALGERRRLNNRDYRVDSPYNTYLIDGLPPHPVSQPSAASIEAVLAPPPTDYLYMVAGADGKHVFSETYREHLAAIRRIRQPGADDQLEQ